MTARLFHISRPVLWINALGTGVIGMWLSGHLWTWAALPVLLWLTLPFNLLIYGANDIFDRKTDEKNPRKGSFEGARITGAEIPKIWTGIAALNLPFLAYFALALPPASLLWALLYTALFVQYSAPPLRFKSRPYLDSLSNAAYALPLIFVPLALGDSPVWPAALGLMAWSAAKHTFDAVQDIREDRAAGIRTTATQLGPRGVVLWSGAWWALSALLFALVNLPVALVSGGYAAALLYALHRRPTPVNAHRLYPLSIAFPYIAGTVAGVQLVAALSLGLYP
ncbi:prenyltransferase [Rubrobacter taiwanensis]|uniref:Prenyltransferase n=1 Tax=Rubrobacter taiwanensis TaxID=185139 RepID=A0A4R1BG13_9ACTN|nr:UbiA family prenyltransferase [Rubrobacter taiwanensis]TCJ16121.1 prenyltransferase [Rubrobacter taiwanensis]